jgi:hypothetical protein
VLDERVRALAAGDADLFLCHDLRIFDEDRQSDYPASWFEHAQLAGLESIALEDTQLSYPFSVPAGQVYSRRLLADVLDGLPTADWRTGADNPIAQAAFLRAGRVHFLQERLALYRIHGANRLLAFDDGRRLVDRQETRHRLLQRRPKLLWYLERYLDALPLPPGERQRRVARIKRLSATRPVSSAFANRRPERLSFVVADGGRADQFAPTLEALAMQTHPDCEVLVPPGCDAPLLERFAALYPEIHWRRTAGDGDPQRAVFEAVRDASGSFASVITAGDRPDRDFAERHLYIHRYLSAVAVTSCDYRLMDELDHPAQEGAFGRRGLWPDRRRLPALHAPKGRAGWIFTPRSGNVFRRSPLVSALAAHALGGGVPSAVPAEWWLLHLGAALGGCLQFSECLTTLRMDGGGRCNGMYARDPSDARFVPRLPQPESSLFLLEFLSAHAGMFSEHFGPHLERCARWMMALDQPDPSELRRRSDGRRLHPKVAELLRRAGA